MRQKNSELQNFLAEIPARLKEITPEECYALAKKIDDTLENSGYTDDEIVEQYGQLCMDAYEAMIGEFGTDEWQEEFERRFSDGSYLRDLSNAWGSRQVEIYSSAAMAQTSEAFKDACTYVYDYFIGKGGCICTGLIGDKSRLSDDQLLPIIIDIDGNRDVTNEFVQVMSMIGYYGGSVIIKCDKTKEVYMFQAEEGEVFPVRAEVIDGFIADNSNYLNGYAGREYLPYPAGKC